MKKEIHPAYEEIKVTCSCGSSFTTRSTLGHPTLHLEVCSECHPFYTGKHKIVDTSGRVERFQRKYSRKPAAAAATVNEDSSQAPVKKVEKKAKKTTKKSKE